MFVGTWENYSHFYRRVVKKCIFSFHPAGLYSELPFCEDFYFREGEEPLQKYLIKEKYRKYGWQDFNEHYGYKTYWWKEK